MECKVSGNVVHVCTSYHKAARKIISCIKKNYCNSAIKCGLYKLLEIWNTMNNQDDYSHEVKWEIILSWHGSGLFNLLQKYCDFFLCIGW